MTAALKVAEARRHTLSVSAAKPNISAILTIDGSADADLMARVIEAAMRSGIKDDRLLDWRRQIVNLRSRADRGNWGWE